MVITEKKSSLLRKNNDEYLDKFDLNLFRKFGTEKLLNNLKNDLKKFNVEFDTWFSETSLYESGAVESTLKLLQEKGYTYLHEDALWLKTSSYRDEKDRVIVKSDGSFTYLLPDIAYHANKLSRGYTHLIDVLGADHHGYIDRLHAAVSMVGGDSNLIDVEILQMVRVIENGEEVKNVVRTIKEYKFTVLCFTGVKGTVAEIVSKKLNLVKIDTGAMYRAMALFLLRNNVSAAEQKKIETICKDAKITIEYRDGEAVIYKYTQKILTSQENIYDEGCIISETTVNGVQAVMLQYPEGKNRLVWDDGTYLYKLDTEVLSLEELLILAESVS